MARYTEPLLKGLGLADYFEIVLSGDSLPEKKPHPMPLLHAAKFFGVPVEQVLLIGDSLNDALAARAAGCPVFCVPYGYNHGEPVDGLDVDAVIADLPNHELINELEMTHNNLNLWRKPASWRWW